METYDITGNPIFNDDEAARLHFERLRWPGGEPVCPHCGTVGEAKLVKRDEDRAAKKMKDPDKAKRKIARDGLYYCNDCNKTFTATMGTVFESSHIPMRKWLLAIHLMCASKKGISSAQLQRMLGLGSYRTAWFMSHRIREALGLPDPKRGGNNNPSGGKKLGGEGKVVEADETYFGKVEKPSKLRKDGKPFRADNPTLPNQRGNRGPANKRSVVALVERGGSARVFHVGNADRRTIDRILNENADKASRLNTDEAGVYKTIGKEFAAHESVTHSKDEYVRREGDHVITSNSVENFFSVFKRGMRGVYQHCGEKYLQRYLAEFEFRYNTRAKLGISDGERAALAVRGAVGKRLTLVQSKGLKTA